MTGRGTGPGLTRRETLALGAAAALATRPTAGAAVEAEPAAATGAARHGLSVFGDLAYPTDFSYFDYVNPQAPKGGRIVFTAPSYAFNQNAQTFNTLNGFVLKGDAAPRVELIFDSLMVRALDEPDAVYGHLARKVTLEGRDTYRFHLRREARFHDGTPLTAQDVAFSIELLRAEGHPNIAQTLREMVGAEVDGEDEVVVRFTGRQGRQLPMFVAGLPVFSKAYYSGRDFGASTLEPPLGSGPYRVGAMQSGRFIEYARVEGYWGRDLATVRGMNNFDVIRLEFFRDRQIGFEAFKKGNLTVWEEFTSKTWATGYDFPAIRDGRVVRVEFPDERAAGAQGFFINTRRAKFQDARVREALIYAFDFEWSNRNLFYGLYTRTHSFFENSDMKATGLPGEAELALLEPHRASLPAELFDEPFSPPTSDGSGQDRRLLRHAAGLLDEAGWRIEAGRRMKDGVPLTIELLEDTPTFDRIAQPFINNLKVLGISAGFRLVDPAQYQERLKSFDFDLTTRRYALSATPGEYIRQYWGSAAAATDGSDNLSGIADPVVDELIDRIIQAESRAELNVAVRALDRVLRAGRYWIPQWYKPVHTMAVWRNFGWPEDKPRYGHPVELTWWYDAEGTAAAGR